MTRLVLFLSLVPLLGSCGFGSAGLAALFGSDSGSSGENATPSLGGLSVQGFAITDPKVAPARIRLIVVDEESDPVDVTLYYVVPSDPGTEHVMRALSSNPVRLATSLEGTTHDLSWNFPAESALPADGRFVAGVKVIARLQNGVSRELVFDLGNDAPQVFPESPTGEVSGIVPVPFVLRDSSGDAVSVRVEYGMTDGQEIRWDLARPGGLPPADDTPEFAFAGIETGASGASQVFFWDTEADLGDVEEDVLVRFTPEDAIAPGDAIATEFFRVDNNAEPFVQLEDGFVGNADARRGIPISYRVFDEEGDPVRLLFQWKRDQEEYADLGATDLSELLSSFGDPAWLRQMRVCVPYARFAEGHGVPEGSLRMRLPELAGVHADWSRQVENLDLELLRPGSTPLALSSTWGANPLESPVAAVPSSRGVAAFVLDGVDSWRIRRIHLATGAIERDLVSWTVGTPDAMALGMDGRSLLVATHVSTTWQFHSVDIESGSVSQLATSSAPVVPIRDIVSIAPRVAVFTAADGVWRLDWGSPGGPRVSLVRGNLSVPWGLAADRDLGTRVWLAERDAATGNGVGRVVSLDYSTGVVTPLGDPDSGVNPFPRPTALAFDRQKNRLIAACTEEGLSEVAVRGWNVSKVDVGSFLMSMLNGDVFDVSTGEAGLVLYTLRSQSDLVVSGGIEQTRRIVSYDPSNSTVEVDLAFKPPVRPRQRWRIRGRDPFLNPVRGSSVGVRSSFVWDSGSVPGGGAVLIRALVLDDEFGSPAESTVARDVSSSLTVSPVALTEATGVYPTGDVRIADLDGDGDDDVLLANGFTSRIAALLQEPPGVFETVRHIGAPVGEFVRFDVADFDGDGDLDVVTSRFINQLDVFLQDASTGAFSIAQSVLGNFDAVVFADVDGDGRTDVLASTILAPVQVVVCYQGEDGSLSEPVSIGPGNAFSVGDVDADGDPDVLIRSGPDVVMIYLQESSRVFASDPLSASAAGTSKVVLLDVDRDGALDLLTSGGVTFQGPLLQFDDEIRFPFNGAAAVDGRDLDRDGDVDLVVSFGDAAIDRRIRVLFQETPRRFGDPVEYAAAGVESVAIFDADSDGALDLLAVTHESDGLPRLFQQFAESQLEETATVVSGEFDASNLEAVDVDGDRDLDLVVANGFSRQLEVFPQLSPGVFAAVPDVVSVMEGAPRRVRAADVDGDGITDLVCGLADAGDGAEGSVAVFFGDPSGGYASPPLVLGPPDDDDRCGAFAVADLNGDGMLDIVRGHCGRARLLVFLQETPRVFPSAPLEVGDDNATGRPISIAADDVDGDGFVDLVATSPDPFRVTAIYYQAEGGGFVDSPQLLGDIPIFLGGTRALATMVADHDGDGHRDLMIEGPGDGAYVIRQTAPRQFDMDDIFRVLNSVVAPADLDRDGDTDLVGFSIEGAGFNARLLQSRPGRQILRSSPGLTEFPAPLFRSLVARDLDGDGDPDIAILYGDAIRIYWGGR